MVAVSNVIPFGVLYMRPLQWWLKTKGLHAIKVTRRCLCALDMWRKPWFLSQGPVTLAHNASDGRIPDRLGSGHEWSPCPRSVEWLPSHVAHQLPGDAGCVSSTHTLSPGPKKSPCASIHRQHSGNIGADILSRQGPRPGEWRLHPEGGEADLENLFATLVLSILLLLACTPCG